MIPSALTKIRTKYFKNTIVTLLDFETKIDCGSVLFLAPTGYVLSKTV
jgi:hypothetical protein